MEENKEHKGHNIVYEYDYMCSICRLHFSSKALELELKKQFGDAYGTGWKAQLARLQREHSVWLRKINKV
jgi:hypothetical protein